MRPPGKSHLKHKQGASYAHSTCSVTQKGLGYEQQRPDYGDVGISRPRVIMTIRPPHSRPFQGFRD